MAVKPGPNPFKEQIDFFKAKDLIPTERWNDLTREAHDTGFMVAGAMQADLLADFHGALLDAHKKGTTLKQFTNDFESIVAKHGWTGWTGEGSAKGRAWRARVIYETNMRTSYMSGRWAQIQAGKAQRPYLIYRHSHSVASPRPLHVAWDGLVVLVDDPWVKTHYPPQGYGCKCEMFPLAERDLKRMRKSGPDTPPDNGNYNWTDPKTGEIHTFPNGVDPFWDYAPGASLSDRARTQIERKISGLPTDIGEQLQAFIKSSPTDAAEKAALTLGVKDVDYAHRTDIAAQVNSVLEHYAKQGKSLPNEVLVNDKPFEYWALQKGDNIADYAAAFVASKDSTRTYLLLNPAYPFWDNLGVEAKRQFDLKQWSTDDMNHIVDHELGHFYHFSLDPIAYQNLQKILFTPVQATIAEMVSDYATDNPIEFVAEVFVLLKQGKDIDPVIMSLYQSFNGPMP